MGLRSIAGMRGYFDYLTGFLQIRIREIGTNQAMYVMDVDKRVHIEMFQRYAPEVLACLVESNERITAVLRGLGNLKLIDDF